MPSLFSGMGPYLEGYLWPDVHRALANTIRQQLTSLLRPRYAVRLAISVVEDTLPEDDVGLMYPRMRDSVHDTPIPIMLPVEVQIPTVEVRDTAHNQLITSIEILSPVNKREPGLTGYRQKRQRLYHAGVHLIELDLLRRGTRPITHARVPTVPYLVTLTRAHSGRTDVWPLTLQDTLHVIPVPLRASDDDVLLDLQDVLRAVYDEAAYDLSINYDDDPPPPALSAADSQWMRHLLRQD